MEAVLLRKHEGEREQTMYIGRTGIPDVPTDYCLVRTKATAVNRADLLQKKGLYPPPRGASPILGLEAAGVVERVGSGCRSVSVGDRVCALLAGGGYAEYVAVHEGSVLRMPPSMSFVEAAAIPEVFLTSFQCLYTQGLVHERGPCRILIHAGASGIGTAATAMAVRDGHTVYVTVGSDEKCARCEELGAADAFNYKTGSWADWVLETTGGAGVDLVICCVGAPYFNDNLHVLAPGGRLVMLGFLGGARVEHAKLAHIVLKDLTIIGSTLRSKDPDYKAKLAQDFANRFWDDFSSGILSPVVDSTFSHTDIHQAHERVAQNLNIGKVVVTFGSG